MPASRTSKTTTPRTPRATTAGVPQDRKTPNTAKSWKKSSTKQELELPSGNVCIVKRPGMDKLLEMGLIPDSLTPIAQAAVEKGKNKGRAAVADGLNAEEIMRDPKKLVDVFDAFDRITAFVVVEPVTRWHKVVDPADFPGAGLKAGDEIPEEHRDEDFLYTDEVDMDDKQFIFQFVVGGTRGLETFRKQQQEALGDVSLGEDVDDTP